MTLRIDTTAPAAILLAAGASTRLGRAKQLEPFGGTTLLQHAIATVRAAGCKTVIVVLGCRAADIGGLLTRQDLIVEVNHRWPLGMGSSIRCGTLALLRHNPAASCAIVMPCDQPRCTPADLQKLIATVKSGSNIAASRYADTRGTPACFAPSAWQHLLTLDAAAGAKKLLGDATLVDLPSAAFDVDTAKDVESLSG